MHLRQSLQAAAEWSGSAQPLLIVCLWLDWRTTLAFSLHLPTALMLDLPAEQARILSVAHVAHVAHAARVLSILMVALLIIALKKNRFGMCSFGAFRGCWCSRHRHQAHLPQLWQVPGSFPPGCPDAAVPEGAGAGGSSPSRQPQTTRAGCTSCESLSSYA